MSKQLVKELKKQKLSEPQEAEAVIATVNEAPQTIELDCAPGLPRPGDLIDGVIEGTGLPSREPVAKFFGQWTWDYTDIDPEVWAEARKVTKERITALYHDGVIRYGSW